MSSSWWLSLSINSRLVPSKFLGGRNSLKSDSFWNQARRSSCSKSKTMGLIVRLASSRPSQCPAKYRSLLVSLYKRIGLLLQIVTAGKANSLAHSVWTRVYVGKESQWRRRLEDQDKSKPREVQRASSQKALRPTEPPGTQMCRRP